MSTVAATGVVSLRPQRTVLIALCFSAVFICYVDRVNISLAIVLWTTAAMLFNIRIDRRYVAVGLTMVLFMFVLNIARLATIGLFPAYFVFLHFGTGAALFGWAGLIGAAMLAGFGVIHAAERQR